MAEAYVTLEELDLAESRLNIAVDTLMEHLRRMEDRKGVKLFRKVLPGLYIPQGAPQAGEVPMCRVWRDSSLRNADNEQFHALDTRQTVGLYLYFFDYNKTGDFEKRIERFVKAVLDRLQEPVDGTSGNDGLAAGAIWNEETQSYTDTGVQTWNFPAQVVSVVQTQALRKVTGYDRVLPPWYVVRIELDIYAANDVVDES